MGRWDQSAVLHLQVPFEVVELLAQNLSCRCSSIIRGWVLRQKSSAVQAAVVAQYYPEPPRASISVSTTGITRHPNCQN